MISFDKSPVKLFRSNWGVLATFDPSIDSQISSFSLKFAGWFYLCREYMKVLGMMPVAVDICVGLQAS